MLAVDLSLLLAGPNTILDGIHPDLRASLYRAPASGDQGDFVNDQKAKESGIDDGLVARRISCVSSFPIAQVFENYEVTVRGQLKRSKSIKLIDAKIKGLVVRALDGGTVEVSLKASAEVEPDDLATLGKLHLIGDIRLTLTPPDSVSAGAEDDDDEEDEDGDESDEPQRRGDLLEEQEREEERARAA
ncbi:hypothetical protein [Lysobacter enzymogenes]|uniref:hypothetical protein n=1 Tax=Lysobacter enzymogenes TaxID=69 RepID=UPI0019D2A935|nr:hypothetical protein [Lysobacter enzymogenes]